MWSVSLVFCDCGFHSVRPLMDKDKRLIEASWLRRKLGLVLMGGAMFSKFLIQFSVEEQGCVPSLLFDMRPNYGGGNEDNGDFLQKVPCKHYFTLVQFIHSAISDSLRPHELQHARPPCPSPTPRVHSNSCSSSQWCHPAISSSVIRFSSRTQSLQGLFQWVNSSHEVAKDLEFQLQHQSFQWTPRTDLL